jgi:hypothetical protein
MNEVLFDLSIPVFEAVYNQYITPQFFNLFQLMAHETMQ